jgi:hypothetical protein
MLVLIMHGLFWSPFIFKSQNLNIMMSLVQTWIEYHELLEACSLTLTEDLLRVLFIILAMSLLDLQYIKSTDNLCPRIKK